MDTTDKTLPAAAVSRPPCEVSNIEPSGSMDRIYAFWMDVGPSQGYVTITCWGSAWTAYFGGMGGLTIKQFFAACGTDYMANKMGMTPWLKQTKKHDVYLSKIIDRVRDSLAQGRGPATAAGKDLGSDDGQK